MDFDQLATFLEVAKHANFSRAAERRFRTQPAISAQIRALEDEIGARLFDRSGGKVTLTQAGKVFVPYAEATLANRKAVIEQIAELEGTPRGEIVVGANEATCLHILPEVFAQFKRQYPKVGVNIRRSERARILESVIDNTVDFGVVSVPVKDSRLTVVKLHEDELIAIVPAGHPLSAAKKITPEEMSRFPFLLPKFGNTREAIDDLFSSRKLRPEIAMELDSSELLKRFVAAGVGIGFIARSSAADDLRAGTLATIALDAPNIPRDLALIYRRDKALSRAALAFIDIAIRHNDARRSANAHA